MKVAQRGVPSETKNSGMRNTVGNFMRWLEEKIKKRLEAM